MKYLVRFLKVYYIFASICQRIEKHKKKEKKKKLIWGGGRKKRGRADK